MATFPDALGGLERDRIGQVVVIDRSALLAPRLLDLRGGDGRADAGEAAEKPRHSEWATRGLG
jgi:hypothetical protein